MIIPIRLIIQSFASKIAKKLELYRLSTVVLIFLEFAKIIAFD
jgi:hypothetical protein